ncbi:AAA family ATPase [Candidatus Izemoplasma sp. B36]|uniref:AAA family ATPase n=1 Tax=Candidatus Izemoplasma sp. B36 TaxID=3242468 RepID=UPI003557A802
MELIAVYILKANAIENSTYIFDSNYLMNTDLNGNKLSISINKTYNNKKFYHIDDKLQIYALLGPNGIGKTTLLECLSLSIKHEYLVFYSRDNDIFIEGHMDVFGELDISINNHNINYLTKMMKSYFSILYKIDEGCCELYDFSNQNRNVVFYSDIEKKDSNSYLESGTGYYLSKVNNFNFKNDCEELIYIYENIHSINKLIPRLNLNKFKVRFKKVKFNKNPLDNDKNKLYAKLEDDLEGLFKAIHIPYLKYRMFEPNSSNDFTIENYIYNQLFKGFLSTFIKYDPAEYAEILEKYRHSKTKESLAEDLINYARDNYTNEYSYNDFKFLLQLIKRTLDDKDFLFSTDGAEILINYNSNFVKGIKELFDNEMKKYTSYSATSIQSSIEKDHTYISAINFNRQIFNELFSMDFYSGSKGEESLVEFLIKIHKTIKLDEQLTDSNNTFVYFDEPDVYLNPELNRKLINEIVKIYEKTNNKYTIIMSTHSPYTLLDIPSSNLLNLNTNSNIIKVGTTKETFGKNISDISLEHFILSANVGEYFANFAKSILSIKDLTKKEKKEIKRKIDIIGDEFLKNALMSKIERI